MMIWNAVTHPCPKNRGRSGKRSLKLVHGMCTIIFTYIKQTCMRTYKLTKFIKYWMISYWQLSYQAKALLALSIHMIDGSYWLHFIDEYACHDQMETFSALLAICAANSPVPGEFRAQRPVTRSFDAFFDLRLNRWVNDGEAGEFRRHRAHYDVIVMIRWVWAKSGYDIIIILFGHKLAYRVVTHALISIWLYLWRGIYMLWMFYYCATACW